MQPRFTSIRFWKKGKLACDALLFVGNLTLPRYIKVKVLEEFLDKNVEAFGTAKSIEVGATLLMRSTSCNRLTNVH
jgi:hypothetical protein